MPKYKLFKYDEQRMERILILAKTDFAVRYYGSYIGLAWAFLNPFARLGVYYFAFSILIFRNRDPSFVLYLFTGILFWSAFSQATKQAVQMANGKKYLLQNIDMNKADIYHSHTITTAIGFLFNLGAYFIMSVFFEVHCDWELLFLPLILVLLYMLVFSSCVFLSILNSFFLDVNHLWDIGLLAGFWSVPIIWDQKFIYSEYPFMMYVNPITGLLINFRNALMYAEPIDLNLFVITATIIVGMTMGAYYLLKHKSYKLAELK